MENSMIEKVSTGVWFEHFLHKGMFVRKEEGKNVASGWDCKGNKFENKFHFIDGRYVKVKDQEQSELLNLELSRN